MDRAGLLNGRRAGRAITAERRLMHMLRSGHPNSPDPAVSFAISSGYLNTG